MKRLILLLTIILTSITVNSQVVYRAYGIARNDETKYTKCKIDIALYTDHLLIIHQNDINLYKILEVSEIEKDHVILKLLDPDDDELFLIILEDDTIVLHWSQKNQTFLKVYLRNEDN